MVVPVVFILMLPIAFAASVKNDDHVDNAFSFTYDSEADKIVVASSSKRFAFDDDVDFTVSIAETEGDAPLVGRVRFGLLAKRGVRYAGKIKFRILDAAGNAGYETTQPISFTLRPERGKRTKTMTFPFDVQSGDYNVDVSFSR